MCALGAGFRLLTLHNAKGVALMPEIKLRLPLVATAFILFVGATGGASQPPCCELAEQMDCRQSVQR
jgi:hypothetical protein